MTPVVVLTGCATATPPSRMDQYVGTHPAPSLESLNPLSDRKDRTGLLMIADQTAEGAAPVLPDEAQTRLTEQLKERLGQSLPLTVEALLLAEGVQPKSDLSPLLELARSHDVDYLLVIVTSAMEQEYPQSVFLGWHSHRQPGLRRDNWSLLEAALIDVKTEAVRGVDAVTFQELGLLAADDKQHLERAAQEGRVVFAQDADFLRLHAAGVSPQGIVYAPQQTSVPHMLRSLMLIHDVLTPDDMVRHTEFL